MSGRGKSGGTITAAEWRAMTSGAAPARSGGGHGARSNQVGKLAEADFMAGCAALEATGRVWWLRLADPLVPRGAPDADGLLRCKPAARARATDFCGLLPQAGARFWGAEVKGTEAATWLARASLRPAQVAALDEQAALGALGGVYLVHYAPGRARRWWLPWCAAGLARWAAPLDFAAPGPLYTPLELGPADHWLDVAERAAAGCQEKIFNTP